MVNDDCKCKVCIHLRSYIIQALIQKGRLPTPQAIESYFKRAIRRMDAEVDNIMASTRWYD